MPYGVYLSAEGANAQQQRLRVLANNLANADTPGFKRDFAIMMARHAEAIDQGLAASGDGSMSDVSGGVTLEETATGFGQGHFKHTGFPTDMAIAGEGFFLIDRDGQQFLTRGGNFTLTGEGDLITQSGDKVLDSSRSPVTLDPALPWRLLDDGVIDQAGSRIAIGLFKPQDLGELRKAGNNLFSTQTDVTAIDNDLREVRGGYLEMSNVNPTLEMVDLIATSRLFEANVRLIQNQDQALNSLVGRVLGV
jgi:flagellar basal-body rod protein FlgF